MREKSSKWAQYKPMKPICSGISCSYAPNANSGFLFEGEFKIGTIKFLVSIFEKTQKIDVSFWNSDSGTGYGLYSQDQLEEVITDLVNKSSTQYFPVAFDELKLSQKEMQKLILLLLLALQTFQN